MKLSPRISSKRLIEAVEESTFGLENIGFCTQCGAEHYSVEPDARRYPCEECGKKSVYGAQELLLMTSEFA